MLTYFDDDCDQCVSHSKCASPEEAREKGRLLKSYRIFRTDVKNDSAVINRAKTARFWIEHVDVIVRDGRVFKDTLFVWSGMNPSGIEFQLLENGEFVEPSQSFEFWSLKPNTNDTLVIGLFKSELVSQGTFVYSKNCKLETP